MHALFLEMFPLYQAARATITCTYLHDASLCLIPVPILQLPWPLNLISYCNIGGGVLQ